MSPERRASGHGRRSAVILPRGGRKALPGDPARGIRARE